MRVRPQSAFEVQTHYEIEVLATIAENLYADAGTCLRCEREGDPRGVYRELYESDMTTLAVVMDRLRWLERLERTATM